MSQKQVIKTSNAPDPVGPYNQAIKAGDFIYCSGQIAIDPDLNEITCLGDIEKETIQVLKNLAEVLKAGGAKIEDVIKTTIYLTDLSNFQIVNKIYSDFFNIENPPARACVEVSSLPKNTLIYCAHEYTKANILWALNLKPKDQDIKNKLSEVEKKLSLNELTIPFLLDEEMKINLFLRAKNLEEFTFLRANKDLWV